MASPGLPNISPRLPPQDDRPSTPSTPSTAAGPSSPRVSHPAAFSSLFPQFHHKMPASQHTPSADIEQYMHETDTPLPAAAEEEPRPPVSGVRAPEMTPELSIELRLRWLEALVVGSKPGVGRSKPPLSRHHSLSRQAEDVQARLEAMTQDNDPLQRFLSCYELYAPLLAPEAAKPPPSDTLSPEEAAVYFAEAEPDVRSADRDMTDVRDLERKGVLEPGRLQEHEALKPRLQALASVQSINRKKLSSLEHRVASLLNTYSSQIDALSERFVEWNDVVTEAETEFERLKKEKVERDRRGIGRPPPPYSLQADPPS